MDLVAVVSGRMVAAGRVDEYQQRLAEEGFDVLESRLTKLSEGQALVVGGDDAARFCDDGPVVCMLVRHPDAYAAFKRIQFDLDDTYGSPDRYTALRDVHAIFLSGDEAAVEQTLAVLKPGSTDVERQEAQKLLEENELTVLRQETRPLTAEQALALAGKDSGDDECKYLTSGECTVFLLEGRGAVDRLQLAVGPDDPSEAKRIAPHTFHAAYGGADATRNCMHASRSVAAAGREIDTLFPEPLEPSRAVLLVKPGADAAEAERLARAYGFTVTATDTVYLSKQRAEEYRAAEDATTLSSGPSRVFCLTKVAAVASCRALVVHEGLSAVASETDEQAERDVQLFFPFLRVPHVPTKAEFKALLANEGKHHSPSLQDTLVKGLTDLCVKKPVGLDAVRHLGEWLRDNNPKKPRVEAPVENEDDVTIQDRILANNDGKDPRIVFALGVPGSEYHRVCENVPGFAHISASNLIFEAMNGTEHSAVLKECVESDRDVPAPIVVELVTKEMVRLGGGKFLVSDFPLTLDQAVCFEETVEPSPAPPVVFFDCDEQHSIQVMLRTQQMDEEAIRADLRLFYDRVTPVINHFKSFSKLHAFRVDDDDDDDGDGDENDKKQMMKKKKGGIARRVQRFLD